MCNLQNIKNLYEDGYRCIYYNRYEDNPIVYLKNFEKEDSKEIKFETEEQFMEFREYIASLKSK